MRIKTKLILAFIVFGLLMLSVLFSSWLLFNNIERDVDSIVDEHSVISGLMWELSSNIYAEQNIINNFITEDDISRLGS